MLIIHYPGPGYEVFLPEDVVAFSNVFKFDSSLSLWKNDSEASLLTVLVQNIKFFTLCYCRIIRKIESGDWKICTLSGMYLQNITLSEARGNIVNSYHERWIFSNLPILFSG